MRFTGYSFGSIQVDGVTYYHDLVIDRGKIRKRKKAASRKFRGASGHTSLSIEEDIPWRCRRLVIGTGADGALPVMQQVRGEARRRKVDLVILPTAEAIGALTKAKADTNAILHLTCRTCRGGTGSSPRRLQSFSASSPPAAATVLAIRVPAPPRRGAHAP
jgi:hypothetical protein